MKNLHTLFLCGLPTVGKTSFGKALSRYTSLPFLDMDTLLLETELGRGIASPKDLFHTYGHDAFNKLELSVLKRIQNQKQIIALGGGTVTIQGALELIQEKGRLIYLVTSLEKLIPRIQKRGIPARLEKEQDLYRALKKRATIMERAADLCFSLEHIHLENEKEQRAACQELLTLLKPSLNQPPFNS